MSADGSSTTGGSGFVAAKLERPGSTIYVAIGGHQYAEDEVVFQVDIIEVANMDDGLITIDADAMSQAIDQYGFL